MTIEVHLCEKFQQSHERRAFGRFLQEMIDRYHDSEDFYLIIGEPEANTASMDMIVLTLRALIVIEMKELTLAEGMKSEEISLHGTENGVWQYSIGGDNKYQMGGVRKERNPYQQVKDHNYKLRDWLTRHPENLSGGKVTEAQALRKIYSWVVISPGFNRDESNLDLPWEEIGRWFKILSLEELAWEIGTVVNPEVLFTSDQMTGIASQLGAKKHDNLLEFVPNYVLPPTAISFFSRPPIPKQLVDREDEKSKMLMSLNDPCVTVVNLGGPGGIGKTYLSAWFFNEATRQGFKGMWLDCSEREVTCESFLAAVADQIHDKYKAAFLKDPGQKFSDKFDLAIDFLDKEPCLLVFKDYHCVSADRSLDGFFTRVVLKAEKVKILLTTRVRPSCLNSPEWPPGSYVDLVLEGLPLESLPEFIGMQELTEVQLRSIWERTSGNPYALGLLTNLLRSSQWESQLDQLPLYNDARATTWAYSLIDSLDSELKSLASNLAVVRSTLSKDLIERMAYVAKEKVFSLIMRLVDAYVLNEIGNGQYQMHGYLREAFLSKANEKDLRKAHGTAGSYFDRLALGVEEVSEKIELLLQAIYHYKYAENWKSIIELSEIAHTNLLKLGDRDRSIYVAELCVKAAKAKNDNHLVIIWLTHLIKGELDLSYKEQAEKNLNEAFQLLPSIKGKKHASLAEQVKGLEAQLWILKGRLSYFNNESEKVDQCFKKGIKLAEELGDRRVLADCLTRIAQIERYRSNTEKAKQYFYDAGNLANKLGDEVLLAKCISHLGMIMRDGGNLNEAKRLFTLAYNKARNANDLLAEEICYGLLGDVALRSKDFDAAQEIFNERLERARLVGNKLGVRISLGWLAEALIGKGALEDAEKLLDECEQLVSEAQDEIGLAFLMKRKGQLELARGNIENGNGLILEGIAKLKDSKHTRYIPDFEKAVITELAPKQFKLWETQ
jgi:ATP/maltotriose-dependent transcriptional regulator MalT